VEGDATEPCIIDWYIGQRAWLPRDEMDLQGGLLPAMNYLLAL
jgi:hypothetical protein